MSYQAFVHSTSWLNGISLTEIYAYMFNWKLLSDSKLWNDIAMFKIYIFSLIRNVAEDDIFNSR